LPSATAFQVLPLISDVDRKLAALGDSPFIDGTGQWVIKSALPMIKSPVHEAITLAALGCTEPAGEEQRCVRVALEALLHMVQDSFSHAHADRDAETGAKCDAMPRFAQPGRFRQFYSYAGQVGSRHDREDTFPSLGLKPCRPAPT
jgi:hypothetical protein